MIETLIETGFSLACLLVAGTYVANSWDEISDLLRSFRKAPGSIGE